MSTELGWQYAVIGLVVVASCVVMVRKLAPAWAGRRQAALAAWLGTRRLAALRWLGRRLAPAAASGGCDSGCSACGGCGSSDGPPADDASPLTFQPRAAQPPARQPASTSHSDAH